MYNFDRLINAGITLADAQALRRISMTLHRWHELECGDGNDHASWCISRGKKTGGTFEYDDNGNPYMETHYHHGPAKAVYSRIPDRERGALKRLAEIMASYPKLSAFVQTDPRGAALYIGEALTDANYNTGIAVFQ